VLILWRFRDRASFRFLGIRYAEQPKRFSYSQRLLDTSSQSALVAGSKCLQNGQGSEDCFFLNIFTPYLPKPGDIYVKTQLKPVMFYIHGGGFIGGSGSQSEYDGGNLASRGDVVVVTIEYRLGVFGFLVLDDGLTNGNFGLGDQVTALDWVKSNIAFFGGDPDRITIFGGSAGAISVIALLQSPKAIGKYAAAMPQSNLGGFGQVAYYNNYPSIATGSIVIGYPILEATGCSSNTTSAVECLRSLPAATLESDGGGAAYFFPYIKRYKN
jgi:carboxylesterase type B